MPLHHFNNQAFQESIQDNPRFWTREMIEAFCRLTRFVHYQMRLDIQFNQEPRGYLMRFSKRHFVFGSIRDTGRGAEMMWNRRPAAAGFPSAIPEFPDYGTPHEAPYQPLTIALIHRMLTGIPPGFMEHLSTWHDPDGSYQPSWPDDGDYADLENDIHPNDEAGPHLEGATRLILINAYERNRRAREECIAHYGCACMVCGMSFGNIYGEIGIGYIHVHHIVPLAIIGAEYQVDPINDLRPVCPNCHAMLHYRGCTIEQLQTIYQDRNQQP